MSWRLLPAVAMALALAACTKTEANPGPVEPSAATLDEVTRIAEEAYVYAYPMMESYRTMYAQAIDSTAPGYLARFNQLVHKTELLGPEFEDVVRPNNDTMYSFAWLDLRAQPVVITVPKIEDRYYSVQLVDSFTHNFGYIGTRATGTEAGSYVIAGPQWQGTKPGDAKGVFKSQSEFVLCLIRTEVRGPDDVALVRAVQRDYRLTPLHVFLGRSRAPAASGITFPRYDAAKAKSAGFVDLFGFLLGQASVAQERELMRRFAKIGIKPGAAAASLSFDPETRDAVEAGVGNGIRAIAAAADDPSRLDGVRARTAGGWQGVDGLFGGPEEMRGKYLVRAVAAMVGLYGNDTIEAYYPMALTDAAGRRFDGSKHRYVMRFERDQMPEVDAFWSMTMYSLPDQLMVENAIDRYSIGDRNQLRYGDDGSLTIYIQRESPGRERATNWLPAPNGPFTLQFRMYVPRSRALNPLYLPPAVRAAE